MKGGREGAWRDERDGREGAWRDEGMGEREHGGMKGWERGSMEG